MSDKLPEIYGYCPAGCKYPTVHREEFEKSAAYIKMYPTVDNGDMNNKYALEERKTYKIYYLDNSYKYQEGYGRIVVGYVESGEVGVSYAYIDPTVDKYNQSWNFKLLSRYNDDDKYYIVYEENGTRKTFEISAPNFQDIDEIYISNASKVLLVNEDATLTAEKGDKGDKGDNGTPANFQPIDIGDYMSWNRGYYPVSGAAVNDTNAHYIVIPVTQGETYKVNMNGFGYNTPCFFKGGQGVIIEDPQSTEDYIITINTEKQLFINFASYEGGNTEQVLPTVEKLIPICENIHNGFGVAKNNPISQHFLTENIGIYYNNNILKDFFLSQMKFSNCKSDCNLFIKTGKYTYFSFVKPIKLRQSIKITVAEGHKIHYEYWKNQNTGFASTDGQAWVGTSHIFPKDKYFTFQVIKNGYAVFTDNAEALAAITSIEWVNEADEVKIDIIGRNADIEHIVHAGCKYGLHANGNENVDKLFSMLVTTDIHHDTTRLKSAIDYLNYSAPIDCGIHLGDMQAGDFSQHEETWYTDIINTSNKPFFTVLGNHDLGNTATASKAATPVMAFNRFIQPTLALIGDTSITTPYYSRQFDDYGIYLICLNNYDAPDNKDASGNYIVSRSAESLSQAQIDWFIQELQNIPANYHLIVAAHSVPANNTHVESNFSQAGKNLLQSDIVYQDAEIIPDIINAWKNGGTLSKTYTPTAHTDVLPVLTATADYSARGKGNFVCYIVGHGHRDVIAKLNTYNNQIAIGLNSSCLDNYQNYACDLPRVAGTKSEDVITVFSVDTAKRKIKLVRVGSNITFDLVDRSYTAIDY